MPFRTGPVGLAASAVGGLETILRSADDFARDRRQFGRPIAQFDLVAAKLARMRIDKLVTESMVRLTAVLIDRGGIDYSLESAICKVYASEATWRAADDALQIAGGRWYMRDGSSSVIRDARITRIFEGPTRSWHLHRVAVIERLGEYLEPVGARCASPSRTWVS